MSVEDHRVSFSLEINVEEAYEDLRRIQTALYRTFSILRRMGLPEDISQGIMLVQRLISTLNQLRLTMIALQAASGPLGWWLALTGLASTQFAASNIVQEVHSH